jgi:Serine dehydrogenase proteinase
MPADLTWGWRCRGSVSFRGPAGEARLHGSHLTDPAVPLDIVLHTPGGLVLASLQIARAIHKDQGKVTVLVPHYASLMTISSAAEQGSDLRFETFPISSSDFQVSQGLDARVECSRYFIRHRACNAQGTTALSRIASHSGVTVPNWRETQ